MKRTTESLEIADQLVDIRIKLRIAAMAVLGLDEDNDDGGAIANMIFDLEGELGKVTEKVYPYQDASAEPDAESSGKAPKAQRHSAPSFHSAPTTTRVPRRNRSVRDQEHIRGEPFHSLPALA